MISRDDVVNAYKFILGRLPENDDVVNMYIREFSDRSVEDLISVFLNSEEFITKNKIVRFDESKWVCTEVLGGLLIWIDLSDRYVSFGCLIGDYEPNETGFVRNHVSAGMTVLDIGANVGWFSLLMSQLVGREGRVISFEPRPDTYAHLMKTIAYNNLDNTVHAHNMALAEDLGRMYICWHKHTDNPGGSYLSRDALGGDMICWPVHVDSLDALYPDMKADFMKIDVEGAEYLVMKGARKALERNRPIIMSEIHPGQLREVSGCSPREYIEFMNAMGYRCREIKDGKAGKELHDYNGNGIDPINVCFMPS